MLQIQGKGEYLNRTSPNPISKGQMDQAVAFIKDNIKDIPIEIRNKLQQSDGIVLGIGINPLYGMQENIHFNKQRILREIEQRLNLDDEAIIIKHSIVQLGKILLRMLFLILF